MSHPYGNIGSSLQPRAIPRARTSKIEPNCSIAMSANALSSPHHTSFPIHRGIIFTMASRRFTVDSAKKKKFVDIFLLMPETREDLMGCVRTTTYALTQTSDWGSLLFGVLHVDATLVKSSWEGRGYRVWICMSSHGIPQMMVACCGGATKGQTIGKYSN